MCSLLICESLPVQSCVRPHQIAAVAIVPVVVGLAHVPHSLVSSSTVHGCFNPQELMELEARRERVKQNIERTIPFLLWNFFI